LHGFAGGKIAETAGATAVEATAGATAVEATAGATAVEATGAATGAGVVEGRCVDRGNDERLLMITTEAMIKLAVANRSNRHLFNIALIS
jgi:hypothetical protein